MDNDDSICISHPDHVPGAKQTPMLRELIRRVPRYPKKMNFVKSIEERCQGEAQLEWFWSRKSLHKVKNHTAYSRLDPDGLIPTITTGPRPSCGFGGGRIIHWDEHRTLTLLEARRAQGFADDEVIIGDLPKQWAQVGNAVNRQVAAVLGEVVAESWFSGSSFVQPEIVVSIPGRHYSRHRDKSKEKRLLPFKEHDDLVVYSSTGTTLLSKQIQKETEALIEEDHDVLEQATSKGDDFQGDAGSGTGCDLVSLSAGDTEVDLEEAAKSSTSALHRESQSQSLGAPDDVFGPKRLLSEESEFLKTIFRPFTTDAIPNNASGEKLSPRDHDFPDFRFNQIQRRKMSTTKRSAAGVRKSIRFTSERSIEVRTKTPSSSAAIEHGSAEHPIEVEAEVTISKRRREERHSGDGDGDDDDDELKHWVRKRVRSRLDD
jgi:C-5 cytosine-specific DNA methylase